MSLSLRENIYRSRALPRNEAVLMGRAQLLSDRDRDLVRAVMVHGQPAQSVARLTGRSARTVRSRVSRLARRMTSRAFLDAARALPYLEPGDALLARLAYCQQLSHRRLCLELMLTRHTLRRRLDRLAAQIQTIRRMSSAARKAKLGLPQRTQDARED